MTTRKEAEKRIVASAIADLLEAGFEVTVYDGEEETVVRSTDAGEIAAAMMTTDEDYLYVHSPGDGAQHRGWVRFVYGNDGPDVINDYTVNLEAVLRKTNELAEQLNEEMFG